MSDVSLRPRWSPSTKVVVSIGLLAFAIYLMARFSAVIPPFILAVLLAYVLTPLVDRVQARLNLHRGLATVLVYLMLLLVLAMLLALLIPQAVDQVRLLNLDLQAIIDQVEAFLGQAVVIGGVSVDLAMALERGIEALRAIMEPVFGQTVALVIDVITSMIWVIFILVISFYLIKDGRQLWAWIERQPPREYRQDFVHLKAEINAIWSDFLRGQLVLATVVATVFSVVGLIIGLPFSLAMGLFAGLMEFIPSVGHGIWLFVASLLTLSQGSTWLPLPNWIVTLIVIGLHLVFQQVDLNYLIPRIIGRRVRLHPLVVILGIVAGATLAGVLGVVLAAPTIASARVIGRYVKAYLFDQDPRLAVSGEAIVGDS